MLLEQKGCAKMKKFMMSLDDKIYKKLQELAESRGITVQELIRALAIPEWLSKQDFSLAAKSKKVSELFSGPGENK